MTGQRLMTLLNSNRPLTGRALRRVAVVIFAVLLLLLLLLLLCRSCNVLLLLLLCCRGCYFSEFLICIALMLAFCSIICSREAVPVHCTITVSNIYVKTKKKLDTLTYKQSPARCTYFKYKRHPC